MNITKGSFCIVTDGTKTEYFWTGKRIENVKRAQFLYDDGELHIKLVIQGTEDSLYMELINSGISVKKI